MKLNEKILYCRKRLGLSQEALAERIGVSRQAVSKWETGDAEPEISKLRSLAQVFGVTTDWLLSDAEPDEQHNKTEEKAAQAQKLGIWQGKFMRPALYRVLKREKERKWCKKKSGRVQTSKRT